MTPQIASWLSRIVAPIAGIGGLLYYVSAITTDSLAEFFGVDLNKARNWVQSKKRQPKPKKKRDKSKLVPVTIRFTYDEVDIMEKVARKNKLPFAEVAREHHKLGTRAFAKKYGFE